MLGDDRGQSNLDFLFGISVFLLTFLYAVTFIPGMFTPYQPGAIDLSAVAYRTSAMLAEDPGWCNSTAAGGLPGNSSWEDHQDCLLRIGLAGDRGHPNILSLNKIKALESLVASDYTLVREKMGLNGSIIYDINVAVEMNGTSLINAPWPSASSQNIESIERVVLIDTGKELFVDCNNPGEQYNSNMLNVTLNNLTSRDRDITIRIYNLTAAYPIGLAQDPIRVVSLSGNAISLPPDDYIIKLNGEVKNSTDFGFMKGDVLEITILNTAISDPIISAVNIWANSSCMPGRPVDYVYDPVFKQKSVCYPGIMRVEVWSYAFS
ncbi:hypothetical protein Mtc_0240 [Methanocella conradii HZ254]|uniref:Uncharacterized protein n=1 Tax=Methanocella conradii (strain DSM 24694 / JCM 17849 / CGMCC 1.5162 / HZ254) TaxID=1041930 RepID=H8I908_METCZ|nr:hypothetical protein [Methanocella conradii]AFC99011.1 hypothetical protein Mtc_0240 [Methanocella conradii HZ254]